MEPVARGVVREAQGGDGVPGIELWRGGKPGWISIRRHLEYILQWITIIHNVIKTEGRCFHLKRADLACPCVCQKQKPCLSDKSLFTVLWEPVCFSQLKSLIFTSINLLVNYHWVKIKEII